MLAVFYCKTKKEVYIFNQISIIFLKLIRHMIYELNIQLKRK